MMPNDLQAPLVVPARTLPVTDMDSVAFWTGGARGELLIFRCADCAYYVHPPVRFCPQCESRDVAPQPVSGRGRIASFTVNHKQWVPGLPVPYVLALVALEEQDDVRIATNIVNVAPDAVRMDMKVRVVFEQQEEIAIPFFEPEDAA
jgi:uncharacterized OB-fold protein